MTLPLWLRARLNVIRSLRLLPIASLCLIPTCSAYIAHYAAMTPLLPLPYSSLYSLPYPLLCPCPFIPMATPYLYYNYSASLQTQPHTIPALNANFTLKPGPNGRSPASKSNPNPNPNPMEVSSIEVKFFTGRYDMRKKPDYKVCCSTLPCDHL